MLRNPSMMMITIKSVDRLLRNISVAANLDSGTYLRYRCRRGFRDRLRVRVRAKLRPSCPSSKYERTRHGSVNSAERIGSDRAPCVRTSFRSQSLFSSSSSSSSSFHLLKSTFTQCTFPADFSKRGQNGPDSFFEITSWIFLPECAIL